MNIDHFFDRKIIFRANRINQVRNFEERKDVQAFGQLCKVTGNKPIPFPRGIVSFESIRTLKTIE